MVMTLIIINIRPKNANPQQILYVTYNTILITEIPYSCGNGKWCCGEMTM